MTETLVAPESASLPALTPETPQKRLFIKTYGCQMNVYDSERMADVLRPLGYATTDTPEGADFVILNTCHIREKAAEKVYSELGKMREMRDKKLARGEGRMTIAVAGCVAQAEGEEIMLRQPAVDLVVGPQAYHQLPELLTRNARSRGERIGADFAPNEKFDALSAGGASARGADGPTAFLSVQEGCDKFCTFCVVPYTRGAEYSRPVAAILREARGLVADGAKEITLLGQNVNAYHGENVDGATWSLGRLIRALAEIDGLARIRYTTSHPRDMDDDLMSAHRDVPQLMPFLHLPVQSGSDKVLAAMNRGHTRDDFKRIIDTLRGYRSDLALSSDFIVGMPGETDKDFAETMVLVRDITFAQSFSFKYSPRPGTPAAVMQNQIPDDVKNHRLYELQALLDDQLTAFNASMVGRTIDVLLTHTGRHPGQIIGRSPYLQAVHVTADKRFIGQIVPLKIASLEAYSLGALWPDDLGPDDVQAISA